MRTIFCTTVEAVQCLTDQTGRNIRTCKKDKTYSVLGGGGRKNFFALSPSYAQSPKDHEKSLCPTVLQLRWVISTWWDENMTLFVFSACYEIHWNWFCGRKQIKNAKIRRGAFLAKSALIGKSIFRTQQINAVHGRCSSSGVLRHIPSNFTRSVRRRIVLQFWALSGGIDMLSWPKVLSKWADGLGQVHCQYGTLAKLRTSCPCGMEFEVMMFFFEGDWYVHKNSSLRMFWYRDLNSSHFFPRFGLLEHEANRTPDISATFIGSRTKFYKRKRMYVCPARKRKASSLSVSYRLNRFNRCSRWRTTPRQILCQNMVRTWYNSWYSNKLNFKIRFSTFNWSKLVAEIFRKLHGLNPRSQSKTDIFDL